MREYKHEYLIPQLKYITDEAPCHSHTSKVGIEN